MKSCRRHRTDGIELPNQDKIRTFGETETNKYLGILEADTIKQMKMKEKIKKEYLRRTRKLRKTKLCRRNLIKGINIWVVLFVWYSGSFLKWTREELKRMDQRTRKLMTMHKTLYLRNVVDRLYIFIYQEIKEEEDLPALKTTLTHRYNYLRTTLKSMED